MSPGSKVYNYLLPEQIMTVWHQSIFRSIWLNVRPLEHRLSNQKYWISDWKHGFIQSILLNYYLHCVLNKLTWKIWTLCLSSVSMLHKFLSIITVLEITVGHWSFSGQFYCTISMWWQSITYKMPYLQKMANQFLALISTTVLVEATMSIVNNINTVFM